MGKKEVSCNELSGEKLNQLQLQFRGITHVIIDEYSMVSQGLFAQMDSRLRQATGKKGEFFGGLSIILVGDPAQLLPVAGSPLYASSPKSQSALQGLTGYMQFTKAVCLQVSQRQRNDDEDPNQARFIEILKRLRNGMVDDNQTLEDWQFLLNNIPTPQKLIHFKNAIRLFSDNASCHAYNAQMLNSLNKPITRITTNNTRSVARKASDEAFSGLKPFLYLAIDSRITLTNNIWTKYGLVNGANGIIRDIIYDDTLKQPHTILVEFGNYSGPYFFKDDDTRHKWIPINPISIYNQNLVATRTQYPIRLAYALTIHKSQGQTLDKVVIDLGKNERSLGLAFVALSRVKNYKDFIVQPFPLDRLTKIKNSTSLKPRVSEEHRMKKIIDDTLLNYHFLL
jgi:ATP-dependent DNA helicase PIF1